MRNDLDVYIYVRLERLAVSTTSIKDDVYNDDDNGNLLFMYSNKHQHKFDQKNLLIGYKPVRCIQWCAFFSLFRRKNSDSNKALK